MNRIEKIVMDLALPVVEEAGLELWDVEYVKEGAEWILRVVIDSNEGVTLDDCERVSRAIDPVLDEADPIEEAYYLEVSSPGIERELRCRMHLEACEGWNVEVRLYAPRDGVKSFRGELLAMEDEDDSIRISVGEQVLCFASEEVAKVKTYFEF